MLNLALFLLASTVHSAIIPLQTPETCKEAADGTYFDSVRLACVPCPVGTNTEPSDDCKYSFNLTLFRSILYLQTRILSRGDWLIIHAQMCIVLRWVYSFKRLVYMSCMLRLLC